VQRGRERSSIFRDDPGDGLAQVLGLEFELRAEMGPEPTLGQESPDRALPSARGSGRSSVMATARASDEQQKAYPE
jgi:hypothetical protein